MSLPPSLLAGADQQKAYCDASLRPLVGALRGDVADGIDPSALWYSLATQLVHDTPSRLATALAAAVLQLAQKPTSHPKGRVERVEGDRVFGVCGCCRLEFHGGWHAVVTDLDRHMRTGWKPKAA